MKIIDVYGMEEKRKLDKRVARSRSPSYEIDGRRRRRNSTWRLKIKQFQCVSFKNRSVISATVVHVYIRSMNGVALLHLQRGAWSTVK